MKWTVDGWTYGHYPYNVIGEPTAVPEVTLTVPSFDNGRRDDYVYVFEWGTVK